MPRAVDSNSWSSRRRRLDEYPKCPNRGVVREVSEGRAEEDIESSFLEGRPAPGHLLLSIVAGGAPVGYLWLGPEPGGADGARGAWHIEVDEIHRGTGIGRRAMELADDECRWRGARSLAEGKTEKDAIRSLKRPGETGPHQAICAGERGTEVVTNDHRPVPVGSDAPLFSKALQLPATGRQVAQFIASRAAACVGADYSNVALLGPRGESLHVYHDSVLEAEMADRYADVPLSAPYPLAQAATGRVVLLADLDAYREQFPDVLADTIAAGFQATASLPLNRADGSLIGAIGFAWSEPTPFDPKLEAALRAVAYLCTETIERAERYDAEHALIVELQDRLLGDIPTLAGIQTGARYLPASAAPYVGGDWYEGLLVSDSEMAVVVGDISGHGVAAAADMALIRGMLSALLHAGVPVSEVFGEVSGVLGQRKGVLLATAALAVVDVAADVMTFATAGHPPPLLRLPDGDVRVLSTANSPILGVSTTRTVSDTAPFPRGAQVVMYTDGLVERRDRGFDVGVAEAAHHLANLSDRLDNQALIDSLLATLVGGARPEDDIAVIVIEHV